MVDHLTEIQLMVDHRTGDHLTEDLKELDLTMVMMVPLGTMLIKTEIFNRK